MTEPTPVRVPIDIRWRDLDALGHVNNAVYLTYFELARFAYIRALEPDIELDPATLLPRGYQFILADTHIRYRSPALLSDRLELSLYISRVGRKSFDFEYRLVDLNTGRLVSDGCSTQVWYDYATQTSLPVPDEAVAAMERLQGVQIPRG